MANGMVFLDERFNAEFFRVGGRVYDRRAWTGGDTPTRSDITPQLRMIRRVLFREQVRDGGPLDLWACAGTSALERARIFWNRATLDAWRTITDGKR